MARHAGQELETQRRFWVDVSLMGDTPAREASTVNPVPTESAVRVQEFDSPQPYAHDSGLQQRDALRNGSATQSARHKDAERTRRMLRFRRLRQWLPKTMVGLVATSKLLAMAPLLATLIILGIVLDRLLEVGDQLIGEGQNIEKLGARLLGELEDLERVALQYMALEDPALLDVFDKRRAAAEQTAIQLAEGELSTPVAAPAAGIAAELHALRDPSTDISQPLVLRMEQVERISVLAKQADNLLTDGRLAIYARVAHLEEQASLARRMLVLSALTMIPLTALLTFGLSLLITRPLNGLRSSIAALGTSNYENPVVIEYPREMARLGEKLEWLRRRLRELEADKDRFLRHVSHELKTPLASLREGTDLLIDESFGSLNTQQTEIASILAESAQDLEAQIHNLLTYAEWRSGQRQIEMTWIDCRVLIEEVVNAQRLPLAKRKLSAELNLATPNIYGQRASLRVSISNLLSNAIKHAPAGSVIEIGAERGDGRCRMSVRDYGRGVRAEDRVRILQPFVRGDEPEEAGVRGTGIGLSIVSETIRAHEGVLEVQEAKPGARFVLEWPYPTTAV